MTSTASAIIHELRNTVAYIGNTGRRAFGAVVFELADRQGQVQRTTVVLTGKVEDAHLDRARTQRMARRLRALGFRDTWAAFCHPQDGVQGTVRMYA